MRFVVVLFLALGLTEQVGGALTAYGKTWDHPPWWQREPACGKNLTPREYDWFRVSFMAELDDQMAREAAIAVDDTSGLADQAAARVRLNELQWKWTNWEHHQKKPMPPGCSDTCGHQRNADDRRAETAKLRERSIYDLPSVSGRPAR